MVDIHSHILYGIDDGSKNIDMSLKMIKEAVACGTKVICATPHYVRDRYEVEYTELKSVYDNLVNECKKSGIDIKIVLGQEVYYTENILELLINKEIGKYSDTDYMLIELPMREFDVNEVCETLYELQVRGINIIIAHPERYKPLIANPEEINKFICEGYLFQLNAGSMVGDFGNDVKKLAEKFINNKIYSFIGSDAHRDTMRTTDIDDAIKVIESIDDNLVEEFKSNGYNMLENKAVHFKGELVRKEKRSLFNIFKR